VISVGNTPAEAGAGDGRDVLLPAANAGTAVEQLRGTELAGWAAGKFRRRGRRRATARRAQPARPAKPADKGSRRPGPGSDRRDAPAEADC